MKPDCTLYRVVCTASGYVVFRWLGNPPPGYTLEDVALVHRVATFVTETEAKDYCEYRNRLVGIYGDDEVPRDYILEERSPDN